MSRNINDIVASLQSQIDHARRSISGHRQMQMEVTRVLAALKPHEESVEANLGQYVRSQVQLAQQRPLLPTAEVDVDPAAQFARQVRRRNNIV